MNFRFQVTLSQKDYIDFNAFIHTRSPRGKRQTLFFRIVIAAVVLIYALIFLIHGNFSPDSFLGIIPMLIALALLQIFLGRILLLINRISVPATLKSEKNLYSPVSVLEFYDDRFVEITDDGKTELYYSAVESVSVVDGKMICFHSNPLIAYLLPISCFESKERYDEFLGFIRTKCSEVREY